MSAGAHRPDPDRPHRSALAAESERVHQHGPALGGERIEEDGGRPLHDPEDLRVVGKLDSTSWRLTPGTRVQVIRIEPRRRCTRSRPERPGPVGPAALNDATGICFAGPVASSTNPMIDRRPRRPAAGVKTIPPTAV